MDGKKFTEVVEPILKERGILKGDFCRAIGVSPNMWSNWKTGSSPGYSRIIATEKYLNIRFADFEEQNEEVPQFENTELVDLLTTLRDREDMRMLFKLAKDASPDDVKQAVKIIEALRK